MMFTFWVSGILPKVGLRTSPIKSRNSKVSAPNFSSLDYWLASIADTVPYFKPVFKN
jgi:hypothetical protein